MQRDLTKGNLFQNLLIFSIPYLISCFLQSFYGLADLFITGQFNGAAAISAVSIGSQVTHMLTFVIVGLSMGTTVLIGRAIGSGDKKLIRKGISNTVILFTAFSVFATAILLVSLDGIIALLSTPEESIRQAKDYLLICFLGTPFIVTYNVTSSIFRGLGDSKSPMYYITVAGIINIVLDIILIGPFGMGAAGAALATVISQIVSVVLSLLALCRRDWGISFSRRDFVPDKDTLLSILKVGIPISLQDGLIQIAFLLITAIANQRGVIASASVGIVEKVISFIFLVPSAMMSSVSAIASQNAGAGKHESSKTILYYGLGVCVTFGILVTAACQFCAEPILGLFAKGETEVVFMGSQYIKTYVLDCIFSGIHFCFNGYFCAYGKSYYSFVPNVISVFLLRVPGAYLATVLFPDTLAPMGLASPMGSLFAAVVCAIIFYRHRNQYTSASMQPMPKLKLSRQTS